MSCKYCDKQRENEPLYKDEDWEVEVLAWNNGNAEMTIYIDNWYAYEGTTANISLNINFCPECGRNLTEVKEGVEWI